jgi:hypothetical protein
VKRLVALAVLVAACGGAGTSATPATQPPSEALASGAVPSPSADLSGITGPNLTAVGFSTDGSGCAVGTSASSFAEGVSIHAVLTMEPALSAGGTVRVALEKDGTEIVEAGQTITVTEPAPCVWGTLPGLDPGHYRMTYTISPSLMGPSSGEFDVTPAAAAAEPAATSAPTPPVYASLATRIIGRLDELAALADKHDELLTAEWAIDESHWVTDNMTALVAQGGTLDRYAVELLALLDVVGAGGDQTAALGRLLHLRDEIATEFALPTMAP